VAIDMVGIADKIVGLPFSDAAVLHCEAASAALFRACCDRRFEFESLQV
jgi:hypothetical protein